MLIAGLGPALAQELGFSTVFAEEGAAELSFGPYDGLIDLMQSTAPDQLQPLLVRKLKSGEFNLQQLMSASALANAEAFGGEWQRVPARALTMGMRQVLGARRVILMATGSAKADAVAAMIEGPLTTACPASWLQVHRDVHVVVDRTAAARLG
jgi:hypothetical protein